jgi:hypothetical protein
MKPLFDQFRTLLREVIVGKQGSTNQAVGW